jgi:hypothetical protein
MAWQKAAIVAAVAAFGCGEDGKGIQVSDNCPPQTRYKYVFLDAGPPGSGGGTGHWEPRKPDGSKFSATELADLKKNYDTATTTGPNGRCLTPYGTALSLDAGKVP